MINEDMFPHPEALASIRRGFRVAEQLAEGWLKQIAIVHGREVLFNLNREDETLENVILSYPGIDTFLGTMSGDFNLFEEIPNKVILGMINNTYQSSYPIFAKGWALVIKEYLESGVKVMSDTLTNQSLGLSGGLGVDRVVADLEKGEEYVSYSGENEINTDALVAALGPDGLIALYAYFHSKTIDEFQIWLAENATKVGNTPIDTVITMARVKYFYVREKEETAKKAVRHALDMSTIKRLTSGKLNTN